MSARAFDSCLTFCTPDDDRPGRYEIQWQFPKFAVTCAALNLRFAQEVLTFVAETCNNPEYRDTPLGNGVYRYMDEKSIDLSQYFQNVQLRFEKLGESVHGYLLRYNCTDGLSLVVELRSPEIIDSFLDGIKEIVDDYVDDSETENAG